jgi:hypothetical protein
LRPWNNKLINTKPNKGCVLTHYGLAIYIKKVLCLKKAKEEKFMETQNISACKNNIIFFQKKYSKRNPIILPSRYYYYYYNSLL